MPRPGWDVLIRDYPVPPQVPTDTGVWFAVGATEKGPTTPKLVQSLTEYEAVFGIRTGYVAMWDAVDTYFREGGVKAWISCVPTTPTALEAGAEYPGSAEFAPGVEIEAAGEPPAGDRAALERLTREELDQRASAAGIPDPHLLPNKDAVIDALLGISPTGEAGVEPQVVTPAQLIAALDKFDKTYGPGQVSAPGNVEATLNAALMSHADSRNRVALIETPTATDAATLLSYAAALRTNTGARYSALFGPLGVIPGVATGSTRTVGWSTIAAGVISRNDARGESPNEPAAGVLGPSSFALDVEKRFTETEYGNLNTGSVNMAQYRYGTLETFGWRTLVDPALVPAWWNFGNARLRMAIAAEAGAIAETYVFRQIDGRGHLIAEFGGDLSAMLAPYWESGDLYGNTPSEAFQVNVGPSVNTPTTIANGELHAILLCRMSPFVEWVVIEVTKVSTLQNIAPPVSVAA